MTTTNKAQDELLACREAFESFIRQAYALDKSVSLERDQDRLLFYAQERIQMRWETWKSAWDWNTTPPVATLSDEEIEEIAESYHSRYGFDYPAFARAIIQRLSAGKKVEL